MKHRPSSAWCVAALVLSSCGINVGAWATDVVDTIPRNQPPVLRTFPPTAAEQTSSGTGKFVIFTREQTNKTNEWDFIVGAWECIPSRTNTPVTKRIEFCHSSWNAHALLAVLPRDNREGLFPRFVRLQVDADDDLYSVNLYDIDYRKWAVRRIWQGRRLLAFGVTKNSIYCDDSQAWFRIDTRSGAISRAVPFFPFDVAGDYWMVRKPAEKTGSWSYHRDQHRFVGHFEDVVEPWPGDTKSVLAPDGRSRAWILVPRPKGEWCEGLVNGEFRLQRDGVPNDIRVPVSLFARAGSGRPVIPWETRLRFAPDGNAEYAAVQELSDSKESVWAIDLKSGRVAMSVRERGEQKEDL